MQWSHYASTRFGRQNLYACTQLINRRVVDIDSCFALVWTHPHPTHKSQHCRDCSTVSSTAPICVVWGWCLKQRSGTPLESTEGSINFYETLKPGYACWWVLTTKKQLSMAATPQVIGWAHTKRLWLTHAASDCSGLHLGIITYLLSCWLMTKMQVLVRLLTLIIRTGQKTLGLMIRMNMYEALVSKINSLSTSVRYLGESHERFKLSTRPLFPHPASIRSFHPIFYWIPIYFSYTLHNYSNHLILISASLALPTSENVK